MNAATTVSPHRRNMWTTLCFNGEVAVDNRWLPPSHLTTRLQDVSREVVACEVGTVGAHTKQTLCPQSTGLITVIKSSYKHPHLTINHMTQGASYEI